MNKKSAKMNKPRKTRTIKTRLPIPDLLLSYVYFLNEYKTASVVIGYDAEVFTPKMILIKGKEYQSLSWDDWQSFYNCIGYIHQFFEESISVEYVNMMVQNNNKNKRFKLSVHNQEKNLNFIDGPSKVKLNNHGEWERLWSLAPLLHSIFSWYMLAFEEIGDYYNLYLNKCVLQNCSKLDYKDFFTPMHKNNKYCNYSRLFNEIPILSKNKLIKDLYYKLCENIVA